MDTEAILIKEDKLGINQDANIQSDPDQTLLADAYATYDRYDFTASKSIRFRGKCIEEWLSETRIPDVGTHLSLDEFQRLNYFAIDFMERVNTFYSYAKSTFDLATLKYQTAYNREKVEVIRVYHEQKIKPPPSEILESIVLHSIEDIYSAYKIADLFCDFWAKQQQKARSLDSRLTSIGIIHSFEKKNIKYET